MNTPLIVSTPAEACAWLELQTGRSWQESELFDAAVKFGVTMSAAPPLGACASELEFVTPVDLANYPTGFRKLRSLGWRVARLYPCHILQVWMLGETETVHAADTTKNDDHEVWFDDPVRVSRDQVRISAESLLKLLAKYNRRRDQFSPPGAASQAIAAALSACNGVPTKNIIERFRLDDKWKEKLRKRDRSRHFDRARVQAGSRAPGRSQTWNPAIFGALLITFKEPGYDANRVGVIINKYFGEWLDAWEAESQELP
ncbi:MAG: hypothetical protein JNL16_01700 [Dechloromonas sp.]|nr:hypothetical protein [Dechloromonas sp.]